MNAKMRPAQISKSSNFELVERDIRNQGQAGASLWLKGELEGKPAGVFTSTASTHRAKKLLFSQ
jgi:hypothetical protein